MRHARRPLRTALSLVMLGSAALVAACQKEAPKEAAKPATPTAAAPKPPAAAKPPAAPKPAVKALQWDDPKVWKRVPPTSSMRIASYQIPPAAGDKVIAELNVFVLGGDVESNILRWVDEFSNFDQKTLYRADRVVNDMSETVVEVPNGTYSGGMGDDAPSDNFGLIGGIVVTPEDSKYFFKLTGPSNTVKAARSAFYGLLDSVRLEGGAAAPTTAKTVKAIGTEPSATPAPATTKTPASATTKTPAPAATKPAPAAAPPAASKP